MNRRTVTDLTLASGQQLSALDRDHVMHPAGTLEMMSRRAAATSPKEQGGRSSSMAALEVEAIVLRAGHA